MKGLYVLVMSCTRFRVNPHSIEGEVKFEGEVTATGLEPRTT